MDQIDLWLKRAKSNLYAAKAINEYDFFEAGGHVFFEEPCFELQQCAEKALKALLLHRNIDFPKTHDLSKLIKLIKDNGIFVPESILDATKLIKYAITTRYPESFDPVTKEEYEEAVKIAENVYEWAEKLINEA
ncbi:MAG: HEPN domain-containing protein [Candidatus Gastranaerophilales bacterium]|nr:HEPN domain-containing protein [Candidatus Gastranaerophilales bacterium]